jgi:hypothetical protein
MTDTDAVADDASLEPDPPSTEAVPPGQASTIGWPAAIAFSLIVLAIGFFGAVVGANAILTKSLALTRTAREWLATALFFVVIIILAGVLRWLQHRGVI